MGDGFRPKPDARPSFPGIRRPALPDRQGRIHAAEATEQDDHAAADQ